MTKRKLETPSPRDDDDDDGAAPPRSSAGYKLGPHTPRPVPVDALWITSNQCCARYGGRSQMWLWRKIKNDPPADPVFPKPTYFGTRMMFSVSELDAYDRALINARVEA
jgi:hypothetical protein